MTLEIMKDLFSFLGKFVTFSESPLNIQRILIYIEKTFRFTQRHNGCCKGKKTSFPLTHSESLLKMPTQ